MPEIKSDLKNFLMENNVVIYQSNETIWATQKAMAQLFGVNVSGISRHLVNVFSSGELDEKSNLQKMQIAKSDNDVTPKSWTV